MLSWRVEIELVFAFHFHLPAVGLNHCFSVEYADLAVVRVNVVQARLE